MNYDSQASLLKPKEHAFSNFLKIHSREIKFRERRLGSFRQDASLKLVREGEDRKFRLLTMKCRTRK